jgi:hypothetical protein
MARRQGLEPSALRTVAYAQPTLFPEIETELATESCTVVFAIYFDSFLFVFATAVLQYAFGTNSSFSACESAILLCLVCYVTTKVP